MQMQQNMSGFWARNTRTKYMYCIPLHLLQASAGQARFLCGDSDYFFVISEDSLAIDLTNNKTVFYANSMSLSQGYKTAWKFGNFCC